jgi:hypothetical protein
MIGCDPDQSCIAWRFGLETAVDIETWEGPCQAEHTVWQGSGHRYTIPEFQLLGEITVIQH